MRIGFDVAQTCRERTGCAWYADSLARAMVEVAPANNYILYHQFGRLINGETRKGSYIEHPSVSMPFWRRNAARAREIWGRIDSGGSLAGNPEIVQSNSFQVVKTGGAKLVFVVYDVSFWACPEFTTEVNRLACQRGVLSALTQADGLIFISESTKNEFRTAVPGWLERSNKPIATIPLASRLLPGTGNKPGQKFWLAVGSLEPRKNYDALFSALDVYWRRSKRPSQVWMVGPAGWKNDRLKKRARELENNGRIRVLGQVDDNNLAALYQQALALIFPSWYEGFGLPVLEAMQCGCPVICSNRTSLSEIGNDAVCYIDPESPESICEAMLALEGDSDLRHQYRDAGMRRASQFSWRRNAMATLEFYRQVLESQPVQAAMGSTYRELVRREQFLAI
jgi:glycosyltransferase involved in cell wall biosynthesis